MGRDPRIDAYIANAQPFARPILERAREMIHCALPEIEEGIKWGMPAFMLGGKNVAGLAAFKAHAAIMLTLDDTAGGGMGSYGKITALDDLPSEQDLAKRLHFARDTLAQGKAAVLDRTPKAEIPVPEDFAAALREAPEAKASSMASRLVGAASTSNGSLAPSARTRGRSASPRPSNGWARARSATGSTSAADAKMGSARRQFSRG